MADLSVNPLADVMIGLLWLSLVAFAVLGGADFGAGVWDLLSWGRAAERERDALINAIGPIWEANEIWLIFAITGTFTAFPIVFSTLSIALFIPGVLALIGVVLRGAAFAYYSHFRAAVPVNLAWGRTFSVSSIIAPFFFGTMAGAIAGGKIRVVHGEVRVDYFSVWATPFPLACGAFALSMCAVLAATYMTVEVSNAGDHELVLLFRRRALLAYLATAALGAIAVALAVADAPSLWSGLTGRALPLVVATMLLGIGTAAMLFLGHFLLARTLIAGTITGIFAAWAIAQYPYLIVPDITIANAAAPANVVAIVLIGTIIGLVLVFPSLWLLLYLFKAKHRPQPPMNTVAWIDTLPPTPDSEADAPQPKPAASGPVGATRRLGARVKPLAVRLARNAALAAVVLGLIALGSLWRRLREQDALMGRGKSTPRDPAER